MKEIIEFDNIIGGQDGVGEGNPLLLKVTRQDHGQYSLTVSRKKPGGEKLLLVHFCLTHTEVQTIADFAERGEESGN